MLTRYEASPFSLFEEGKMTGGNVQPVRVVKAADVAALERTLALYKAALELIAAQTSGVPGSPAKADCMAAMASVALREAQGD